MKSVYLTQYQRGYMELLKKGWKISEIENDMDLRSSEICRSLNGIEMKTGPIVDDINFLLNIGYLKIVGNQLELTGPDADPRHLRSVS